MDTLLLVPMYKLWACSDWLSCVSFWPLLIGCVKLRVSFNWLPSDFRIEYQQLSFYGWHWQAIELSDSRGRWLVGKYQLLTHLFSLAGINHGLELVLLIGCNIFSCSYKKAHTSWVQQSRLESTLKCGGWISEVRIFVQRCIGRPLPWECSHSNPCVL